MLEDYTETDDEHFRNAMEEEYYIFAKEDTGVPSEAVAAEFEMFETPKDIFDTVIPFELAKHKALYRRKPESIKNILLNVLLEFIGKEMVVNNPLTTHPLGQSRAVYCIVLTGIFMLIQSLILNYSKYGVWYDPANYLGGPFPDILVSSGSNKTNLIRQGQVMRLLWATWMHSGNMASAAFNPCVISVGPLGGICGLLGGVSVYYIDSPHPDLNRIFGFLYVMLIGAASVAIGFTENVDNYSVIGGFIGGCLFTAGTISRPGVIGSTYRRFDLFRNGDGRSVALWKRFMRNRCLGQGRLCDYLLRSISLVILAACFLFVSFRLFVYYEFQPIRDITYMGEAACCCCYKKATDTTVQHWYCKLCDSAPPVDVTSSGQTWSLYSDS